MHQTVSTPAPAPLTAKQRRARRKKQIIFGSIGLVVLWIAVSIIWSKREKPIPVTTERAIRKTIMQTVSATGKVQPETEVKISPEVAGEIIELNRVLADEPGAVNEDPHGDGWLVKIKVTSDHERSDLMGAADLPSALRMVTVFTLVMTTMLVLNYRLTVIVLPLIPVFILVRRRFHDRLRQVST